MRSDGFAPRSVHYFNAIRGRSELRLLQVLPVAKHSSNNVNEFGVYSEPLENMHLPQQKQ
jgi:hypothetical protein